MRIKQYDLAALDGLTRAKSNKIDDVEQLCKLISDARLQSSEQSNRSYCKSESSKNCIYT